MILPLIFLTIFNCSAEMSWANFNFKSGPSLQVEVAKTFIERNKGLMHRTSLASDKGMLFVFENPQKLSFWMKDTYVALSLAYFDKHKVLKEIHQMKPQSMMERSQDLKSYPSKCDCQYVLEVNQGWFKKNNVKVGDKFSFTLRKTK